MAKNKRASHSNSPVATGGGSQLVDARSRWQRWRETGELTGWANFWTRHSRRGRTQTSAAIRRACGTDSALATTETAEPRVMLSGTVIERSFDTLVTPNEDGERYSNLSDFAGNTAVVSTEPSNGSARIIGTTGQGLLYLPDAGFEGTDTYSVSGLDADGNDLRVDYTVRVDRFGFGDAVITGELGQARDDGDDGVYDSVSRELPPYEFSDVSRTQRGAGFETSSIIGFTLPTESQIPGDDVITEARLYLVIKGKAFNLQTGLPIEIYAKPDNGQLDASDAEGGVLVGTFEASTAAFRSVIELDAAALRRAAAPSGDVVLNLKIDESLFSGSVQIDYFDDFAPFAEPSLDLTFGPNTNTRPQIDPLAVSGDEDTAITGQVTATDAESDTLTFALDAGPANGSVTVNDDGSFSYQGDANFNGTDSFIVSVTDGELSDETTVTVNVAPVNDIPVATSGTLLGREDETVVFSLSELGSDVDGDDLTIQLASPGYSEFQRYASLNEDGTAIVFEPDADVSGSGLIRYRLFDGESFSWWRTRSVFVVGVNDPPVAVDDAYTLGQDTSLAARTVFTISIDGEPGDWVSRGEDWLFTEFNSSASAFTPEGVENGVVDSVGVVVNYYPPGVTSYPPNYLFEFSTGDGTPFEIGREYSATRYPFNDPGTPGFVYSGNGRGNNQLEATFTISELEYVDGRVVSFSAVFNQRGDIALGDPDGPSATGSIDIAAADADGVLANDTDPDHGTRELTAAVVSGPASGDLEFFDDGTFIYTPDAGFSGDDTFTYQVTDASGATSNVATVTLTVQPSNRPPVVEDLDLAIDEDTRTPAQLAVSDPDGDDLTFTVVDAPTTAEGFVILGEDGAFEFLPQGNFNGEVEFGIEVSDGEFTETARVRVTVLPVNDPPSAGLIAFGVSEDRPRPFDMGVSDAEGDEITYSLEVAPEHGTVTFDGEGGGVYTPDENYVGEDSFVVRMDDGTDFTLHSLFPTVFPRNDAPVAEDDAFTLPEDAQLAVGTGFSILNNDSDEEGDPLTAALVDDVANGALQLFDDGTLIYTPDADFNGTDSFTYRAVDDSGAESEVATVTFTVTARNDAPVADDLAVSGDEDTAITGQVTGSDLDGDDLAFSLGDGPANGSVTVNADGSFSYQGDADFNGDDSFTVILSDGLATDTATVSVTVTPVNDAPVAADDVPTLTVPEDGSFANGTGFSILNNDIDVDGDELTAVLVDDVSNGTLTLDPSGAYIYIPDANFNGIDTFTYQAVDEFGLASNVATVTITVTPENDPPVADDLAVSGDEDTVITGQVTGSDIDGDDLNFTLREDPSNGSVTVNSDGTFEYVGDQDFSGTDSFVVLVDDGRVGDFATVTVTVNPVNDAPVAADLAVSGDEDTVITGQVTATDADGDDLTFALASGPSDGTVTVNGDGTFSYQGDENFNGSDSFTVTVTDGELTDTATVSVTVDPVNDAPVLEFLLLEGFEDGPPIVGQMIATDVDGDELTFRATVGDEPFTFDGGTFDLNEQTGEVSLILAPNDTRDWSFSIFASDGELESGRNSVIFRVLEVNDAPVADDLAVSGDEDTAITGQVTAYDVDNDRELSDGGAGDVLTFSLGTGPANGSVTVNSDGTFEYTGDQDFNGTDSFTVLVSDGQLTDTATVTVTVAPVNDAPVAAGGVFSVDENSAGGTAVGQATATDPDGDPVSFAITGGNEDGQFEIDADSGAITVADGATLDFETQSSYTLTVEASDGELMDEAIVEVLIGDVNEDTTLQIGIDIDPRDDNNRVSVVRDRWLRVALLGGENFDVEDIDLDSITFGVDGDDTSALQKRNGRFYGYYADVNRDGTRDLVLYFDLWETGIFDDGFRLGEFEMTLRGMLDDGTEFEGTDLIDLTLFRRR